MYELNEGRHIWPIRLVKWWIYPENAKIPNRVTCSNCNRPKIKIVFNFCTFVRKGNHIKRDLRNSSSLTNAFWLKPSMNDLCRPLISIKLQIEVYFLNFQDYELMFSKTNQCPLFTLLLRLYFNNHPPSTAHFPKTTLAFGNYKNLISF